ncbi:Transposase [Desulfoscipio geothermicus DSM 3669]|uniref:Transposase n=1 Tax=Desulfoscipio geothermicus DSM 3669 TaxID=1121426 RepID=A0A1I6E8X8_9FIRM|nr:transposase [Desulfoscipio geothermicus]SFR13968.1 Transposase [Desulfoscipio geothermicus DSM 3669]
MNNKTAFFKVYNDAMRKTYSGEFKAKVVLEIFKEEKTISQIASEYGIL